MPLSKKKKKKERKKERKNVHLQDEHLMMSVTDPFHPVLDSKIKKEGAER
jgi:hypothetical protein